MQRSVGISPPRVRARSLSILLSLLLLSMLAGAPPQQATSAPPQPAAVQMQQSQAAAPCLSGDPYDLDALRAIISSDDPPRGEQVITTSLTVEFIGQGVLTETVVTTPLSPTTEPPNTGSAEGDPEANRYGQVDFIVFNTRTQNEFRLRMQEDMLDTIGDCHQQNGMNQATEGFETVEQIEQLHRSYAPLAARSASATGSGALADAPMLSRGWSNNSDTRVIYSGTKNWPYRAIAQFRYGNTDESRCTGTMIGPRHLITAAHCINNQGTNTWLTIRVAPGKNGVGVEPYGSSTINVNPAPGTEAWYFTPWQWRDPNLTHWQWDWGLIVIPDRLGDLTDWMGYVAVSSTTLKSVTNYNRGYPLCNNPRNNQPANCQNSRLYGDTNPCGIGSFYNAGSDGWNRRVGVSCDMSGGHSGSAVYHYTFDGNLDMWVPVVAMVTSTETCAICTPSDTYPNIMRRITPADLDTISWLRETFP